MSSDNAPPPPSGAGGDGGKVQFNAPEGEKKKHGKLEDTISDDKLNFSTSGMARIR